MRPRDTSPEAWKVLLDLVRRMTPEERLQRALEYSDFVRGFAEAGVRSAFPSAGDREVFLRAARRRLGPALFRKVYPDELPDDQPIRTGP
ncbi:MAG: hypothetical protein KGN36_20580 [Acidobacteriota bacterium]|nr:hypothetical protein [Acidobacteriota bacterium]